MSDRMSARQFSHHLANPRAALRVLAEAGTVLGYALVLVRAGTRPARLYSIAVDHELRGRGLGAALLGDAERAARRFGRDRLRLEVRADNRAALALYRGAGYQPFDRRPGYYEDGMVAVRLEKTLARP